MSETITVLQCAEGIRLAKYVPAEGKISDYDCARTYAAAEVRVSDLTAIRERLISLSRKPRCCVVRGALINGPRVEKTRRLLIPDSKTGDAATIRSTPRRWLALDLDGVPLSDGIPHRDVSACAREAVGALPEAFGDVRCIAQATASHGLKPGARLRLWYWLDRPVSDDELRRWLAAYPVDRAVFVPSQPIYTAAPIFEMPERDPVPNRIVDIPGSPYVITPSAVALAPAPRNAPKPIPLKTDTHAQRYAYAAMQGALMRISGAGKDNRHKTCLREAIGLTRLVEAGLVSRTQVTELLAGAIAMAGKDPSEGERIAAWGLAHPSNAPLPESIARG
jgi:hypothetical protein